MIFYVAFDDTDTLDCGRGTGKLARWFADELPSDCKQLMVVRQQLLHAPEIPMTSHNSSLCCVVETPDATYGQELINRGIAHLKKHFFEGSDPGFCVAKQTDKLDSIIDFGIRCTHLKTSQKEALKWAKHIHLSGHGGTNDGIIGALAAVGLTHYGESGRIVDYADLRQLPQFITAKDLRQRNIFPISVNRHAEYIPDTHLIDTLGSLRPHLWGKRLTVPLVATGADTWQVIADKKNYDNPQ